MMNFKSEVEYNDMDDNITAKKVSIEWKLDIDARGWGVKDFVPVVRDQKIKAVVEKEDSAGESYEDVVEINVAEAKIEFDGVIDGGSFHLYPTELEKWRGKYTVKFHV